MRKGIIVVTVWTLVQHVQTRSWYGKLLALFWKGSCSWPSGRSVKPSGRPSVSGGFCTCLSIFLITLCSSIELRQNWCRWKATKKRIQLYYPDGQEKRPDRKIKRPDALQNLRSLRIPFQTRKQLTVWMPKTTVRMHVPETLIMTRIRTCKAYK
jgi:hypothetical protein